MEEVCFGQRECHSQMFPHLKKMQFLEYFNIFLNKIHVYFETKYFDFSFFS